MNLYVKNSIPRGILFIFGVNGRVVCMLDLRDTLFTYNQIIQTYGDFRADSRGETVQNNDVFLVITPDNINNSKVVMYVNNGFYKYDVSFLPTIKEYVLKNAYYFRVTNYIKSYVNKYKEVGKAWEDYYGWTDNFSAHYNISYINDIFACEKELYKHKNNVNNTRKMNISEYMGRPLKPGSFVYYIDTNVNKLQCGVIISGTQIYTINCTKKKYSCVLLVENLNQNENNIKSELARKYNAQARGYKSQEVNVGDVYISGQNTYLYLGQFNFLFEAMKPSTNWMEYQHDATKKYWIKLNTKSSVFDINNFLESISYRNTAICKAFGDTVMSDFVTYQVDDKRLSKYYSIRGFDGLIDRIATNSKYVGHVDLGHAYRCELLDYCIWFEFKDN